MPKLGMVVALPDEARALFGRRGWLRVGGWPVFRATLPDGTELTCIRSGMGSKNARAAAQWLVNRRVAALAVMGVSGGLDPELNPGDLVLAEKVVEEGGATNGRSWSAAQAYVESVREALSAAGIPARRGRIVSCRQPALTVTAKKTLHDRYGALTVDMESAAVARVAGDAELPFLAMRSVCDPAQREAPRELFDVLDSMGRVQWPVLLGKLCRRPRLSVDMIGLKKDYDAALAGLRRGWLVQLENRLPGCWLGTRTATLAWSGRKTAP